MYRNERKLLSSLSYYSGLSQKPKANENDKTSITFMMLFCFLFSVFKQTVFLSLLRFIYQLSFGLHNIRIIKWSRGQIFLFLHAHIYDFVSSCPFCISINFVLRLLWFFVFGIKKSLIRSFDNSIIGWWKFGVVSTHTHRKRWRLKTNKR